MHVNSLTAVPHDHKPILMDRAPLNKYGDLFIVPREHKMLEPGNTEIFEEGANERFQGFFRDFFLGKFYYQEYRALLDIVITSLKTYGPWHFGVFYANDPRVFVFASLVATSNLFVASSLSPIVDLPDAAKGTPTKYSAFLNPLSEAMSGVQDKAKFFVTESFPAKLLLASQEMILENASKMEKVRGQKEFLIVEKGFSQAVSFLNKTAQYLAGNGRNVPQFEMKDIRRLLTEAA